MNKKKLFVEEDLLNYSAIKIKNSNTECYLKRYNDINGFYWAKCIKINTQIKEIEVISIKNLLKRLNSDVNNYILMMKG